MEKTDGSIIKTALRETAEEIGLNIDKCDVWGSFGGCSSVMLDNDWCKWLSIPARPPGHLSLPWWPTSVLWSGIRSLRAPMKCASRLHGAWSSCAHRRTSARPCSVTRSMGARACTRTISLAVSRAIIPAFGE